MGFYVYDASQPEATAVRRCRIRLYQSVDDAMGIWRVINSRPPPSGIGSCKSCDIQGVHFLNRVVWFGSHRFTRTGDVLRLEWKRRFDKLIKTYRTGEEVCIGDDSRRRAPKATTMSDVESEIAKPVSPKLKRFTGPWILAEKCDYLDVEKNSVVDPVHTLVGVIKNVWNLILNGYEMKMTDEILALEVKLSERKNGTSRLNPKRLPWQLKKGGRALLSKAIAAIKLPAKYGRTRLPDISNPTARVTFNDWLLFGGQVGVYLLYMLQNHLSPII